MSAAPKLPTPAEPPAPEEVATATSEENGVNEEAEIFEIGIEKKDFGKVGSLRYEILTKVLAENYDVSIGELKRYLERESEYPNFKEKITRYINHSIDLIYAIKAKRNFPGIGSLTRAKQHELREKFKEHFKELRYILLRIESVESNLRVEDARSTIYVIRALWLSCLGLVLVWFLLDVAGGLALSSTVVISDLLDKAIAFVFERIGL